jgi:hypothetical protein
MRDTTQYAEKLQAEIQERMGGAGRLIMAYELSTLARSLALAGLQERHPTWTLAQLYLELYRPGRRPAAIR